MKSAESFFAQNLRSFCSERNLGICFLGLGIKLLLSQIATTRYRIADAQRPPIASVLCLSYHTTWATREGQCHGTEVDYNSQL